MSLRLNGQFLMVGAIGAILASLLIFLIPGPEGPTGIGSIPTNVVFVLSGLFLLVGLPALYRAQAKQIGILGLAGVVLLWVATVLLFLVLSGVQILDVAVPGSIPHPGGDGPPPLAIIPMILGVVLTFQHLLRAFLCWPGLGGCDPQLPWEPNAGLGVFGTTELTTCDQDAALSSLGSRGISAAIGAKGQPCLFVYVV